MKQRTSCTCNAMSNLGDAAPRLWECDVHGKTGMAGVMMLILRKSSETDTPKNELWDEAKALLNKKKEEYWADGMRIYYCEDYFLQDLPEYFWPRNLYSKPTPEPEPKTEEHVDPIMFADELSPFEELVKQVQESTRLLVVTVLTIFAIATGIYYFFF